MSATLINSQPWTGNYPTAGTALTFTAGDSTNKNVFRGTGSELLFAKGGASAGGTATLKTVANSRNRMGDQAATIAATELWVIGPLWDLEGLRQADGIHVDPSAATVFFGVIQLR